MSEESQEGNEFREMLEDKIVSACGTLYDLDFALSEIKSH
jgi:hypothetical protein